MLSLYLIIVANQVHHFMTIVFPGESGLFQQDNAVAESSTRCNFRKHMQIEKAPANQENIFISLTTHTLQMLTTQPKKETHCKCSQHNQIHFILFFWLCCEHLQRVCCQIDESVLLICKCFFLFAARFFFWLCCEHLQRVLSNRRKCFLNLQVFFLFAAR